MLQVGSCPAAEHMGSAACTEWAGEERPPHLLVPDQVCIQLGGGEASF